ncbi:uncharacterized protein LOC131685579 [Topomyia yanbarensis]|uniref:uncharacterized protein LOC131685579 n=1 Tax=Topomyia yanbarensis TaxID=2498891 RepID=UPI00273B4B04|nr:uncharacterized protein LOC131685579 [Topomyia yanbarensis]
MKVIIALFVAIAAVSAEPWNGWNNGWNNGLNVWGDGLSGWNHGLNGWNGWNSWNDWSAYPTYAKSWTGAGWPVSTGLYGRKTSVQANVARLNPWGLPWGTYGAGSYG